VSFRLEKSIHDLGILLGRQRGIEMAVRTDGRTAYLFLALVLSAVFFAPSIARAQQVGTVTRLSGSAQIQRAGATISVVQGMAVQLHDRLATSVSSSATVTLTSGISLTLAEHTNLTFNQNVAAGGARNTELNLLEGGLRSIVPVLFRTEGFEIHTPNAVTAVRGTDFDTTYIEGIARPGFEGCQRYTDVRVREGVVAVSNLANPTEVVEITAGYETTVPCMLPPLTAGPLGIAGAVGPGGAGSRGGGGGGAGGAGAAAAAVGFSAPPPGTGSSPPPAAASPPKPVQ
jgi:FecR protein